MSHPADTPDGLAHEVGVTTDHPPSGSRTGWGSHLFNAAILAAVPDIVSVRNLDTGQVLWANDRLAEVLGPDAADVTALSQNELYELVHPDDRARLLASTVRRRDLQPGEVCEDRFRLRGAEGWRWVAQRVSPFSRHPDGRVSHIVSLTRDVSAEMHTTAALAASEESFRTLTEQSSDLVSRHDPQIRWLYASASARWVLGRAPEDLLGKDPLAFVHPDDLPGVLDLLASGAAHAGVVTLSYRFLRGDGRWIWLESTGRPILDATGAVREFHLNSRDITERMESAARVRHSQELFQALFDVAPTGKCVVGADGTLLQVNRALTTLLGRSAASLTGQPFGAVLGGLAELREGNEAVPAVLDLARDGRALRLTGVVVTAGQLLVHVEDVTLARRHTEELEHAALHDPLTGLPNRALAVDRIQQALAYGRRTGRDTAVLFIDLDDFKRLNDRFGHEAGDAALVAVAQRLRACVREGDTAARLGGDEFVVICPDVGGEADDIARRVRESIRRPLTVAGSELNLTASIGIAAVGPAEDADTAALLHQADAAMYTAKRRGRDRAEAAARTPGPGGMSGGSDLAAGLHHALQPGAGQLRLHYQPVVDPSGRVVAAEALLRWQHPELGLLLPAAFLDVAEGSVFVVEVGEWVLHEALVECARWQRRDGEPLVGVAVNLSAGQLGRPGLVNGIVAELAQTGLAPHLLTLEVTQQHLLAAGKPAEADLRRLRELGVQIAVEHFGTGPGPLTQLRQLPAQVLKLDRSFVAGVATDAHDRAVARAVIDLAAGTGRSVVAEGVETTEQWWQLQELGYRAGQGFGLHLPMPPEGIRELIGAADGAA